jgi:hypothetical protein
LGREMTEVYVGQICFDRRIEAVHFFVGNLGWSYRGLA